MRFKRFSLDDQLKKTEKMDEKTVARDQFLKSKEWQDHLAEHHTTGRKAQLLAVTTTEDSGLFQKMEGKKDTPEEKEAVKQQHTVDHSQISSSPRTGYLAGTGVPQQGAGDEYFGAGSSRLKAISGQCSCGMEISTGWQPQQTTEQKLKSGYATPLERDTFQRQGQPQPLYTSDTVGQQERQTYTLHQPSVLGNNTTQRQRKTTAL